MSLTAISTYSRYFYIICFILKSACFRWYTLKILDSIFYSFKSLNIFMLYFRSYNTSIWSHWAYTLLLLPGGFLVACFFTCYTCVILIPGHIFGVFINTYLVNSTWLIYPWNAIGDNFSSSAQSLLNGSGNITFNPEPLWRQSFGWEFSESFWLIHSPVHFYLATLGQTLLWQQTLRSHWLSTADVYLLLRPSPVWFGLGVLTYLLNRDPGAFGLATLSSQDLASKGIC